MDDTGFAIATLGHADWTAEGDGERCSLTDRLGCAETTVDAYRTRGDGSVSLPEGPERLCVPVGGGGTLALDEPVALGATSVALVPAGRPAGLGGETTWLVVGAGGDAAPDGEPVVLELRSLAFRVPSTSEIPTARLTDRLGCRGMKVNARLLGPGNVVPYHTEGSQEELFVPIDGNGTVRIDGETFVAPQGSVTRVAPEVPRSAVNPGEDDLAWLMVGAPPIGAADEWDPGAEIHEWPGSG
jgi:mannose-6-phosphate isomerase-like protein (cupin superfamily)